ncbi:hypothetical protein BVI434_1590022 [Burkholderia vietnamiensis]|nr:hypothetical protein BVI434_1590022 [Burkholderia vietnamiensis]
MTRPSRFARMRDCCGPPSPAGLVSDRRLGGVFELVFSGALIQRLIESWFNSPR